MTLISTATPLIGALIATVFAAILATDASLNAGPNAGQVSAGGLARAATHEDTAHEDAFALALAAYDAGRYGEAARIWSRLSDAGDAEATAALAGLYRQGLGVPRDLARAARLYRRAGLRGHVIAQANFAEMLIDRGGLGPDRDQARAWAWFHLAGSGGNAWAKDQAARLWAALPRAGRDRARAFLRTIRKEIPARP
ncbi:MAG: hypothetical protein O7E53_00615 [Alphaproteobacteria bacterium]|nr:hypothetical protein [Alphaproteobacteria bacterium]